MADAGMEGNASLSMEWPSASVRQAGLGPDAKRVCLQPCLITLLALKSQMGLVSQLSICLSSLLQHFNLWLWSLRLMCFPFQSCCHHVQYNVQYHSKSLVSNHEWDVHGCFVK